MPFCRIGFFFVLFSGIVFSQSADTIRLSRDDAVTLALARAPEPRRALAARNRIDAETRRTLAPPPPQLSVEYDFIPRGSAIADYGERSIAVDQTLPSPWSWYYTARRGSALRDQARSEEDAAMRSFTNAVTVVYYRLGAQRQRTRIAEDQLRSAEIVASASEARYRSGDIAQTEVLTARALLAEAQMRHERQAAVERRHSIEFMSLLGSPEDGRRVVYVPSDALVLPATDIDDSLVLARAAARSPRILAARHARDAAQAASALAISDLFPSFSVGVLDQRQTGLPASYGVRVGMSVPLWFAFDQRQNIRGADARLMEAEAELEATELAVRAAALSALEEFHTRTREAERYQRTLLPDARALVELTERAWSAGEADILDVIQARRHHASVSDDAVIAVLACLEASTEIQSLLNLEEK